VSARANGRGGIQVIARAGQVLRSLAGEPAGLSLAELAARVELPKSTVHRIVTALEAEGLTATAAENGRYLLGPELIRLAGGQHQDIRSRARPLLEVLSRQVNEAVDLSILVGDRVVFVDHIEAPHFHPLRAVSAIGASFPTYSTANGRALLAAQSDDQLQKLIPRSLKADTPNTITDRDRVLEEIARVRRDGYSIVREEHTLGISAIGAVVRDKSGSVAAVSVPVPTPRFEGRERELIAAVLGSCRRITELLGG
jgi:DNA-binding IclR family transcriptional regulator